LGIFIAAAQEITGEIVDKSLDNDIFFVQIDGGKPELKRVFTKNLSIIRRRGNITD